MPTPLPYTRTEVAQAICRVAHRAVYHDPVWSNQDFLYRTLPVAREAAVQAFLSAQDNEDTTLLRAYLKAVSLAEGFASIEFRSPS